MEKSPSASIPRNSVLAFPDLDISPRRDGDRFTTYAFLFSCVICLHAAATIFASKSRQSRQTTFHKQPVWLNHLDPILGLDILWHYGKAVAQGRLLEWTRGLLTTTGPTFSWLYLGRQAILTLDPVNLKTMLSDRFDDFGLGDTRKNGLRPLFGSGIFNSDGAIWKYHRAALRPFLSRVRDNELNIFETHVQQLKSAVPKNGTKFDMQQLFGSFTLDVSTNVFLGMSTNLLSLTEADRTEGQRFAKAFDYAQCTLVGAGSSSVFEFVRKLVFGDSELKDSLEVVDKFVDKILDCSLQHRLQHEASGHSIDDSFLGALMAAGRSRSDIKYDIINLLVAGKDTTAAYLSSTWYMLSKHPEVYQRLCDEISVLEDRAPTKEDLNHFPYLQMVLQEVARLFPPVAVNQRTAEVDTILPHGGGPDGQSPLHVRKGMSVGYSVYAMHRIPEYFGPDVDEFRPERWAEIRPQWAYMPFHAGPRTCLGKQFALALVKYCTIRLIQELPRPQDRNDRPWQERLALNCSSKHGVKVSFESAR